MGHDKRIKCTKCTRQPKKNWWWNKMNFWGVNEWGQNEQHTRTSLEQAH